MAVGIVAPEHLAFETVPEAVSVVRDGRIVYVNAAWSMLMGMERSAALGKTAGDIIQRTVAPEDKDWAHQHWHRTESQGARLPDQLWFHVLSPTLGPRLVRMLSWPGLDPRDQVFVLMSDEEEARALGLTHELVKGAASLLRFRDEAALIDAALDVLAAQTLTCGVLFADGEYLRAGPVRQPAEVTQALLEFWGGSFPADLRFETARLPHLQEVVRTRRAVFLQEMTGWAEVAFPPVVLEKFRSEVRLLKGLDAPLFVGEELYGFLSVQSPELTPSAAAAIELFATNMGAALENVRHHQMARERLAEVQRLQLEVVARERLSVLGEAAAVMAHEMQNPLGVILNGVELLKPRPLEDGSAVLKMMEEEARSLERLAKDLLAWAKPLSADFTRIQVCDLLRDAAAHVSAAKQMPVRLLTCDENLRLWGDGYLLKLALSNLLRNAIQVSPAGAEVLLWAETFDEGRGVRLVVEDRGPGVPPPLRQRIFEPFFTSRAQGSGLGLALVARVIQAHSGRVRVLDAVPNGARFEVELPSPS